MKGTYGVGGEREKGKGMGVGRRATSGAMDPCAPPERFFRGRAYKNREARAVRSCVLGGRHAFVPRIEMFLRRAAPTPTTTTS